MKHDYEETAELFKALAHPTRLQILDILRQGEMCVCHIEAALKRRQAYISQQLMCLRDAGLVHNRRDGLQVYYRLTDEHIHALLNHVLGDAEQYNFQQIEACPCPTCTEISVSQIR